MTQPYHARVLVLTSLGLTAQRMRAAFILLISCLPWSGSWAQSLEISEGAFFNLPDGFEDLGVYDLRSDDERLGGLSALLRTPDGTLLTLSDQGTLIEIGFEGELFGTDGLLRPPTRLQIEDLDLLSSHSPSSHRDDAESLAWLHRGGNPRLYISFERDHRVQRHLPDGRAERRLPQPIALQGTFGNTGIEALSSLPGTCLFAVTEGVHREGGLRAFRYCGGDSWPTRVYLPSGEGFAPTAADLSPDGQHVYLIERRLEGLLGFKARLVRVPVAAITAGDVLVPELVLDLSDHMLPTWNLEGLAMTQAPNGDLVALMISDDGFQVFLPSTLMALKLPNP